MTAPAILTAEIAIPVPTRMQFIAACPASGCSCLATDPRARACVRTDCGLALRHHHTREDAA